MNKKYIIFLMALFTGIFLFLQEFNRYHFYYVEQFQLFLTTTAYFVESILYPGGFTEYISHFLVQLFIVPFVGAFITAILLSLIYLLSDKLLTMVNRGKRNFIASVSICLFHLLLCFDYNYFFHGIIAYLLCIGCLFILEVKIKSDSKYLIAFFLVPLLYWSSGSVSILFAVCFILMNLRADNKRKLYGIFVLVFALFISFISVHYSLMGNYRMSFLPDLYYHPALRPISLVYISWIILPLWIIIIPFPGKIDDPKMTQRKYFLFGTQILVVICVVILCIWKYADIGLYRLKKLDYFARNERWDKIIKICKGKDIDNLLYLDYQNLALAQRDLLIGELFNFSQSGVYGLEITQRDIGGLSPLLSDIRFYIGDIASSQRYAFEGNLFSQGGSGRLLKRLVQTNLIFGEYPVAEKYIKILEHTFFYRKWAKGQRCFLYNDSLCMADHLIGAKRNFLPSAGRSAVINDLLEMSRALAMKNYKNKAAQQYMFASYLLQKDVRGFTEILTKYRGEGVIDVLPDVYQQALLVYYEDLPNQWNKEGISEKNIQQFKQYKLMLKKNYKNPNVEKIMKRYFGSTYWFFLHFT